MNAPLLARDVVISHARLKSVRRLSEIDIPFGVVAFCLLCLCIAGFSLYISDPRTLPVRHVLINGEFVHVRPDVLQKAAEKVVRGGFFNVNVETVREEILREPWIQSVTVRRVWPDSLSLFVIEQKPVARWRPGGLLNRDGEVFSPATESLPQGLPLLNGPPGTERLVLERFNFIDGVFAGAGLHVMELALSDRRAWRCRVMGGPEVIIGRIHFVERIRRSATALGTTLHENLAVIERLDMRYTNGFAVRWSDPATGNATVEPGNNGQKS